jgi:hypothetical protein
MATTPSMTTAEMKIYLQQQKEKLENEQASRNLSQEELNLLTSHKLALDSILERERLSVDYQKERLKEIQLEREILLAMVGDRGKLRESERESVEIQETEINIKEEKAKLEAKIAQMKKDGVEINVREIADEKKRIANLENDLDIQKQKKKVTDDMASSAADILNLKVQKGSFFDVVTGEDGELNVAEFQERIVSFGKKFKEEYLNPQNLGAKIQEQMFASTKQAVIILDSQTASLRRATGAIDGYTTELNMAANFAGMNSVSMEKTGEAMLSLANNFSEFTNVSSQARVEMAATIGTLSNLGVSSDVASKNMSTLIQSFGMTTSEAIQTSKELAVLANTLGTSPQKIASDFAGAASTLVVYGEKGIDVFRGLEAAAKASGLEVATLVGIVKKMDTFQGAAEAAGKLNAVLGGGLLNSSQLLVATEEERIRLVVESVQSQGVQFKDMDKYTQMSIANAAGITDMAQANKLFGMSLSEYDKYVTQTEKSKDATEKFSQMSLAATTMTDKFKVAMMQLATFAAPLLFILSALVDGFAEGIAIINKTISLLYVFTDVLPTHVVKAFGEYIDFLSKSLKTMLQAIGFAIGLFVAYKAATLALAMAKGILALASTGLAAAQTALNVAMSLNPIGLIVIGIMLLVGIIYYAIKNFETFGKVLLFLLGPIGLVVMALKMLWDMFHKSGSPELYDLPNHFGKAFNFLKENILFIIGPIGLVVMGLKSLYDMFHKTGSGPLWHIAVDMAEAFEVLANVFSTIPSIMDRIAESMGKMAASTFKLFYAISGLAGALPLFALGLVAAAPAMLAFAGASFVMNVTGGNYLKKILSAITPEKSAGLKVVVDSLDSLNKIHKEIKPEGLKNVKELVDEVERYNFQLLASSALNIVSPLESLIKAVGSLGESKETKGGDLILKVDGREIGRIAISAINASGGGNVIVKNTTAAGTRG